MIRNEAGFWSKCGPGARRYMALSARFSGDVCFRDIVVNDQSYHSGQILYARGIIISGLETLSET